MHNSAGLPATAIRRSRSLLNISDIRRSPDFQLPIFQLPTQNQNRYRYCGRGQYLNIIYQELCTASTLDSLFATNSKQQCTA